MAHSAIAEYKTEYLIIYEENEQPIQITPEVYAGLAESFKSSPKPAQRGFRAFPGVSGQALCSCVSTARVLANKEFGSIGYARNLKPNTDKPEVGDIVVLDENAPGTNSGHLAVIKQIWADTYVIMEGNYERCAYTEREISKTYNKIIGFYH